MQPSIQIDSCEVCGSRDLEKVLDLGPHPMCDDLVALGSDSIAPTYQISILHCRKCNTAHQEFQIPKRQLFPDSYHYRSRLTGDVLSGMEDLVLSAESIRGSLKGLNVLDIGCNDGSLLNIFRTKGSNTVGVEPTRAALDAMNKGHTIVNDFFSSEVATRILNQYKKIDIITFTNVFAHIENLPELLTALAPMMGNDTTLIIENHYLGSILSGNQFDTFYHEHPRTYSLRSFVEIANKLGKRVSYVQMPKRYGGNIRVFIGDADIQDQGVRLLMQNTLESEAMFPEMFIRMNSFIETWKKSKKEEIQYLISKHGKLVAKAFPGRAAILIKLLELTEQDIECVYEKPDSPKLNHYVPGTRIPIKCDQELFEKILDTEVILNLAWHIPKEISKYLTRAGFTGQLVHIL